MAKLHELLPVASNLKGQASKTLLDLKKTFQDRRHLFGKKLIVFNSNTEGVAQQTREQSDIESSVQKEIDWISPILAKAFDAAYHIDLGNMTATADIILEDGTPLLAGIPATSLLQLEKQVREVQELIKTIPTLDPAKGFTLDSTSGYFKARDVIKDSTKKETEFIVVVAPTPQHPAQVKEVTKDRVIGTIQEQEWSSMITPAKKAVLMERCEEVFRAITRARSRANDTDVDVKANKIGQILLDAIFQPLA